MTLLELVVTLVILAVVAAAAMTTYGKTLEHARAETAINDLRAIRVREKALQSLTGQYTSGTLTGAAQLNPPPAGTSLRLAISDGPYVCSLTGDGATFTVTATPNAARAYAGTIALNHDGSWGGTSPFVPSAEE